MFTQDYDIRRRDFQPFKQAKHLPTILQIEWEYRKFLEVYKSLDPKVVLEIGRGTGASTYHLIENSQAEVISVSADLEEFPQHTYLVPRGPFEINHPRYHKIDGFSQEKETLDRCKEVIGERNVDVLFIDGSHAFRDALSDYTLYGPLVKKGIIVLHDILTPDVQRLWRLIQRSGRITQELIADLHRTDCGIGIVYIDTLFIFPGKESL
jgi:predicted O-methyltransferase YrrM